MGFSLQDVVPWGRTLAEYRAMFALTEQELRTRILGCGDGPASFNAEANQHEYRVVSSDPIYRYSVRELQSRIAETAETISTQLKENPHEFVWTHFSSPDALIAARMAAMEDFLADYPLGLEEERYVEDSLPGLPFTDRCFDLALCSHFLFLYSEQYDLEFHIESIAELCRVSGEVRVFPLLELGSVPSRHLEAVVSEFSQRGHTVEIVRVDYEVQRGGNQMLRVAPPND